MLCAGHTWVGWFCVWGGVSGGGGRGVVPKTNPKCNLASQLIDMVMCVLRVAFFVPPTWGLNGSGVGAVPFLSPRSQVVFVYGES